MQGHSSWSLRRRVASAKKRLPAQLQTWSNLAFNGRRALPHSRFSSVIRWVDTDMGNNVLRASGDYASHAVGAMGAAVVTPCLACAATGRDGRMPAALAVCAASKTRYCLFTVSTIQVKQDKACCIVGESRSNFMLWLLQNYVKTVWTACVRRKDMCVFDMYLCDSLGQ